MKIEFESHLGRVNLGGRPVIREACCTFAPGWTHIIGPNGAGKSTWIRALAGLLPLDGGSVRLNGRCLENMGALERARWIAYVPQRLEAVPELDVLEFVSQGTYAWGMRGAVPAQRVQRASAALGMLGIAHLARRRLHTLSGGELEMCILASAVAQRTRILLLDEPTAALDIGVAERFCRSVRRLARKGMIVISVTHDLGQAARYADRILLMSRGQIVSDTADLPSRSVLGLAYHADPQVFARYADIRRDVSRRSRRTAVSRPRHIIRICRCRAHLVESRCIGSTGAFPKTACLKRNRNAVLMAAAVCACALAVSPWIGATAAFPWDASREVFWQLRVPRVIWGALGGGVLAVCGSVLQSVFQNALATPYTLGLASGASLGAMLVIQLGFAGIFGLSAASCVGGMLTMGAVIAVSSRMGRYQSLNCLLAGIAASMFCSAAGLLIQAFATPMTAHQMMRWQLGGLEVTGYASLLSLPVIAISLAYLYLNAERLDMLSVDAELAAARGVSVVRTRALALLAAGIATSVVVSMCGPIGFIGLIVPHILRRIYGGAMKQLITLCAFYGAAFLVIADAFARVLERFAWIPVGVVTAAVGAPVLVYLIRRR